MRMLQLITSLLLLMFVSAKADISGEISSNTDYLPGTVMDFQFVLDLNSPDDEGACYIELEFPPGIIPTGTPAHITGNGSTLEFWGLYNEFAYWGGGMGIPDLGILAPNGDPYIFSCQVVIAPILEGPQEIGFVVAGEQMGGSHVFGGSLIVNQSQPYDLAALTIEGSNLATIGEVVTHTITVQNSGNETVYEYSVELFNTTGELLGSVDGVEIAPQESSIFEINWTPDTIGENLIYGKVNFEDDGNSSNDLTENLEVFVQDASAIVVSVGEGDSDDILFPYSYAFQHSLSEQIFYSHEINMAGELNGLQFEYIHNQIPDDAELNIWIGETDSTDLESGFITADQLQHVYTGTPTFENLEGELDIIFDTPYNYTGKNLVLLVGKESETDFTSLWCNFISDFDSDNLYRSRVISSASNNGEPLDPNLTYADNSSFSGSFNNTRFFFDTEGVGNITGVVRNSNGEPLAGAMVQNLNTLATTYTNQNGEYNVGLLEGSYNFSASYFGYDDQVETTTIAAQQTSSLDFALNPRATITVSGEIVNGHNNSQNISGAKVTLTGYGEYDTISMNDGSFNLENIYVEKSYLLTIKSVGFINYYQTIDVETSNLDLGSIHLTELPYPVNHVDAELNDNNNISISWEHGEYQFCKDDGEKVSELGNTLQPENALMGTVFKNHAVLNSVSWFLTDLNGTHSEVNIVILGLNDYGWPDSNNLLYQYEGAASVDNQWSSHHLTSQIGCENGFYVGINTPFQWTSLGMDDGVGEPFQFETQTHFVIDDWVNESEFFDISFFGYSQNFMVRAEGMNMGEISFAKKGSDTAKLDSGSWIIENSNHKDNSTQSYSNSSNYGSRDLESFNIYRLTPSDLENPENWDLLGNSSNSNYTDSEISSLPGDQYLYAVEAIYANDNISEPRFSNIIIRPVSVEENIPSVNKLHQNYPNPFNPATTINYQVAMGDVINLSVYNANGELVTELVKSNHKPGHYSVEFDGTNLSSGIYYYSIKSSSFSSTRKMILVK